MTPWEIVRYEARVRNGHTDGATAYYEQLYDHLAGAGMALRRHEFTDVLRDDARLFDDADCVLASAGPYAYLYHYHRERTGGRHPIVRDVHSGLWTGYLMQEWLCEPLTRRGDVVVFPSHYARDVFAEIFPGVASTATLAVGHPRFAGRTFPRWQPRPRNGTLRIGILGRLSNDKRIPDAIDTALLLHRRMRIELHVLGTPYDVTAESLHERWRNGGGAHDALRYWGGNVSQAQVEAFFHAIDVLLFLSTSNVEALGRVVIEARHFSVPVCIADYAAAEDLSHPWQRVPVIPLRDWFTCDNGVPVATIDPEDAAEVLLEVVARREEPPIDPTLFHAIPFSEMLATLGGGRPARPRRASCPPPPVHYQLPPFPPLGRGETLRLIRELLRNLRWWMSLEEGSPMLESRLLALSQNPERTRKFLDDVAAKRMNYADLAGFPFHLAQLANFHPRARIAEASEEERSLA